LPERDGASGGGGRGLSRRAGGMDARARSARLGDCAVNLGNALAMLGERESGTARVEEAVAAYRAALEEMTPQTDPTNCQSTMENLDQVLTLLKKKSGQKYSMH
jgi:hypothetical protein